MPTIVMGGEQDALIPTTGLRAMAEQIPGACTVIMPEPGHLPPIERASMVNEALMELLEDLKVVWWREGSEGA